LGERRGGYVRDLSHTSGGRRAAESHEEEIDLQIEKKGEVGKRDSSRGERTDLGFGMERREEKLKRPISRSRPPTGRKN